MSEKLQDDSARERIANDLDATLVVEAAAGTGKTTALVTRMVRLLASARAGLDRMVALTFTEAAAGELKLRLRSAIERARQDPATPAAEQQLLTDALPHLEQARIGTIHSFCADLLRERPVEAGIDPLFEVAADDVAGELFGRAFDRWFERQLEAPREGVRRVLRWRFGFRQSARALLRSAAWNLVERRDFTAPWQRHDFDRDGEIDALLGELAALAAHADAGDPADHFVRSLRELAAFVRDVERREAQQPRDHDALEAALRDLDRIRSWRWRGFRRAAAGFPKAELLARRDALKARLEAFVESSGANLAPLLRDELWEVVTAYETLKERAGCLDFLDLLARARDLVRDDAQVRAELQQRFSHVFVDEFQDTDPLQAEILLLLAADDPSCRDWQRARPVPGKLFLVGDPKQSIYRFRRADVALYESVKRRLLDAGASLVYLTVSFRAVPELHSVVNAAFAPRMRGDSPGQASYVALDSSRAQDTDQPAVVALPVPSPYGDYGTIVNFRIEDSLPDAVAAFVDWLVRKSGWTVTERERPHERVPIAPRHVCVLFRRFRSFDRDMTRGYARALEARGLPHLLVGGGSFHQREEVEALRNALAAIERPDDELMVFAALRGPLFALADAALLAYRERVGSLHPFRRVPEDAPPPVLEVAGAMAVLRELHRGRNRRPIAETLGRLLAATRAHAAFAIWPTGEQALANVARLLDLARRAERRSTTSFRAFVQQLEDDAEQGEAREAPIFEEGTEGVRIMTVHRAKGLEFPIVILADMTARETPEEPQRHVDPVRQLCAMRIARCSPRELLDNAAAEMARERDEATRLLYVAATRARDLLVVPVVGDGRFAGWLSALDPAIHPAPEQGAVPESRDVGRCPKFGRDSVVGRPPDARRNGETVAPGLHRPEAGTHRVVWWDPAVLELGARETVGLRQQRLLAADEGGVRAEESVAAHQRWQQRRAEVRLTAAAPSVRVVTPSSEQAAALELSTATRVPVAVERLERADGPRPHGTRFGALVHAVLASVPFDAAAEQVSAVTRLHARVLGASEAEGTAATALTLRALAHPILQRAARAAARGLCRREAPVSIVLDGVMVEGVVDAAFRDADDGPWTVVDFKTDMQIGGRLSEYVRQVELYALAIARATGTPAEAVLLQL